MNMDAAFLNGLQDELTAVILAKPAAPSSEAKSKRQSVVADMINAALDANPEER